MTNHFYLIAVAICLSTVLSFASADPSFWFLPQAPITKYQVTMVVPKVSTGSGLHAVWPGLQNDAAGFVFQSVVADSFGAGSWKFFVEYCCNPNYVAEPINVWPGDTITSTFTLGSNNIWTDAWSLVPGPAGSAAGQKAQTGSTSQSFADKGALTRAILAIELQEGGKWDFGEIQWSNIAITASTTNSWCATNYGVSPTTGFSYSISGGTSSTVGSSTTCTYPKVQFIGLK